MTSPVRTAVLTPRLILPQGRVMNTGIGTKTVETSAGGAGEGIMPTPSPNSPSRRHLNLLANRRKGKRIEGILMDIQFPKVRMLNLASEETGTDELVSSMDKFLGGFRWAERTGNVWVGDSIPGVLGLFLVELNPAAEDIDQYIWVIVGDIPPAYISSEFAKSPKEALEGYIAEMAAWVEAVEKGESVDDLIPVSGAPTQANAAALRSRLSFIESRILPGLD